MGLSNASGLADYSSGIGTQGATLKVDATNQRVGIGTTNPQATLQVGTGVTVYGNSGIVSATKFYGDGSNLSNTGSTLSAASGVQRVVVTSQTSGTMTASATDADITFNAGNNTLFVGTASSSFVAPRAIGIGTTNTDGRDAGIGTAIGTVIFNNEGTGKLEVYTSKGWVGVTTEAPEGTLSATGGTKIPSSTSGDGYNYHVFLFPNSDTFSVNSGSGNIELLLVAGGGSGGNSGPNYVNGGGGGAGGVAYAPSYPITPGTYPISVGSGGVSPFPMDPTNPSRYGGNTTFTDPVAPRTITALGGGAGGSGGPGYGGDPKGGNQGAAGGSSGGGAGWGTPPSGLAAAAATQPGQPTFGGLVIHYGNTGGPSGDPTAGSGVGGGGGGAGTPAPPNVDRGGQLNGPPWFNGPGGPGQPFTGFPAPIIAPAIPAPVRPSWTPAVGPTGIFGGGGGAGSGPPSPTTVGTGGPGGGAPGSPQSPGIGIAAVNYTGGGGGGNGHNANGVTRDGGAGGHGILLIRYQG